MKRDAQVEHNESLETDEHSGFRTESVRFAAPARYSERVCHSPRAASPQGLEPLSQ